MPDSQSISPRLSGGRFDDHTIPLEVLKDLAALEELLLELARVEWLKDHQDRQRTPRGFSEGVSLTLVRVTEGSAIAEIRPRFDGADLFPPEVIRYFFRAWETLAGAVADAAGPNPRYGILPEKLVGYFNRLGRSLKPGEAMEFPSAIAGAAPRLTSETRRRILLSSSTVKSYTEEVTLWGTVPEADQEKSTFDLQLVDERRVKAPLPTEHAEAILAAFNGYKKGTRIRLRGIGEKNRSGKLLTIESIEQAILLDALDVPSRLDEFRALRKGWLDGDGLSFDSAGLDKLAAAFTNHYPDELPLPYTFPTETGGIQFEWLLKPVEASLEVDLETMSGWWHALNHETDVDAEESLDLSVTAGWARLAVLLNESGGVAQ